MHPKWFKNTVILCDAKPVCVASSTKKNLQVDIWLANHSFYTRSKVMVDSEGRIDKFIRKYNLKINV